MVIKEVAHITVQRGVTSNWEHSWPIRVAVWNSWVNQSQLWIDIGIEHRRLLISIRVVDDQVESNEDGVLTHVDDASVGYPIEDPIVCITQGVLEYDIGVLQVEYRAIISLQVIEPAVDELHCCIKQGVLNVWVNYGVLKHHIGVVTLILVGTINVNIASHRCRCYVTQPIQNGRVYMTVQEVGIVLEVVSDDGFQKGGILPHLIDFESAVLYYCLEWLYDLECTSLVAVELFKWGLLNHQTNIVSCWVGDGSVIVKGYLILKLLLK